MVANLVHPKTGYRKQVKKGFSWTVLFFGALVPLIRGDFKWAVIMMLVGIIGLPTYGTLNLISTVLFSFNYNDLYIDDLVEKGYIVESIQ